MLSGPVALWGFKSLKSSSSSIKVHPLETRVLSNLTIKVQVISSTISFTFKMLFIYLAYSKSYLQNFLLARRSRRAYFDGF